MERTYSGTGTGIVISLRLHEGVTSRLRGSWIIKTYCLLCNSLQDEISAGNTFYYCQLDVHVTHGSAVIIITSNNLTTSLLLLVNYYYSCLDTHFSQLSLLQLLNYSSSITTPCWLSTSYLLPPEICWVETFTWGEIFRLPEIYR